MGAFIRFITIAALVAATGCVKLTLAWTDMSANGPVAAPAIEMDHMTPARWRDEQAPAIRALLEASVYGRLPESAATEIVSKKLVDAAAFDGAGVLEEYELIVRARFGDVENVSAPFKVSVLLPTAAEGPSPVIMMETFCPRWDTIPHPGVSRPDGAMSCNGGFASGLMKFIFGRYIATPPLEEILARGYGVAAIFPGDIVPDNAEAGLAALAALSEGHRDDETRWGAVAAWGWVFSRVADVLLDDARVDPDGVVTFGHSRYGKAALAAAAFDDRIAGAIAHQSGTGGASLNRQKRGESVKEITQSYPHWFSRRYAGFAGREGAAPVDQHHLLALIAPRPVLLGNARRDVWSDPNGAFRAGMGADPVYELLGVKGLAQPDLRGFDPSAELSYWIRPGTHGVVEEDWPAFLAFLDAHFKPAAR